MLESGKACKTEHSLAEAAVPWLCSLSQPGRHTLACPLLAQPGTIHRDPCLQTQLPVSPVKPTVVLYVHKDQWPVWNPLQLPGLPCLSHNLCFPVTHTHTDTHTHTHTLCYAFVNALLVRVHIWTLLNGGKTLVIAHTLQQQ